MNRRRFLKSMAAVPAAAAAVPAASHAMTTSGYVSGPVAPMVTPEAVLPIGALDRCYATSPLSVGTILVNEGTGETMIVRETWPAEFGLSPFTVARTDG